MESQEDYSADLSFVCLGTREGMKELVQRLVADGRKWAGGAKQLAMTIQPLVGRLYATQAISAWETGRVDPPAYVVFAIAKVSGLSIDELVLERSMATRLDQVEETADRLEETLSEIQEQVRRLAERLDNPGPKLLGDEAQP